MSDGNNRKNDDFNKYEIDMEFFQKNRNKFRSNKMGKYILPISALILLVVVVLVGFSMFKAIPAGHVGVATLFGEVQPEPYKEGMHFPVNPLYSWHMYDTRQKTHQEQANVPTQDQLSTTIDVSVQYRVDAERASNILQETGTAQDMIAVHLIPKLRSILREQGKSLERAEEFFLETTQERMQKSLSQNLRDFLEPKGITVESVLIRDIRLPQFITRAIESKKEREQEVEKQKAELERFKTEQQQKVVQASAEREAAEQEAAKKRVLAEARAFEIQKINEAVAGNQAYIQLQALDSLKAISKDPASKLYFINGQSNMPLPLMHLGENMAEKKSPAP
jgi:regulator of protease activity HflC (stomatin/prohibitin superfamily)